MDIAQEMLITFNYDPDVFKKFITGVESWVYGYVIETKVPIITIEAFRRAMTGKSTSSLDKCEGFNHCHKVQRSIRSTALKLYAHCAKHDNVPDHTSMLVSEFLAKNKTLIASELPY